MAGADTRGAGIDRWDAGPAREFFSRARLKKIAFLSYSKISIEQTIGGSFPFKKKFREFLHRQ